MIILKILLYILLCILGLVLSVIILSLVLPVSVDVSFIDGRLKYKLKFSLIPLADSDGKGILRKKKRKKKSAPEIKESEEIPESYPEDDIYDSEYSENEEENDIDVDIDIPVIEDFEEYEEEQLEEIEEKERSEKIRKIKEKKSVKKEESPEEEEENSLTDKIEFLINIWDIAGRPLLKIFRGFHIRKVYIDFIVANEDAYKCALIYGTVSGMVYNLLAWLGELFTVSYKTVDIRCGFALKKSQWDASCKVSFRLYTLIFSALWFLTVYLFKIYIPKKKAR